MSIELEQENIVNIESAEPIEISADDKKLDACVEKTEDLKLTVNKREYSVVGDGLYARMSSDEAPQWLTNIIDDVVNGLISGKVTSLEEAINSINQSLLELDVAKNRYQELINIEETIDGVLAAKLETLNATVQQNSANIIGLDTAKVTPEEALAISIDHLNAQINDGDIYGLVTELRTAIANAELTAASQVTSLETVYNGNQSTIEQILSSSTGEYSTTSNVITDLETVYNGNQSTIEQILSSSTGEYSTTSNVITDIAGTIVNDNGVPVATGGIIDRLKSDITDGTITLEDVTQLRGYLNDPNAPWRGGTSTLSNTLNATKEEVTSQFKYESTLTLDGVNYDSGFGLASRVDNGNGTGTSEFWINADKFKMTTTGYNGTTYRPFEVNGTTGEISFLGKVAFGNVTGTPTHTSGTVDPTGTAIEGSTYRNTTNNSFWSYTDKKWVQGGNPDALTAADLGATGTTVIHGGRITTGTIDSNRLNVDDIFSKNITYTGTITGGTVTGGGIIQSANGNMVIDLVEGSIYIS